MCAKDLPKFKKNKKCCSVIKFATDKGAPQGLTNKIYQSKIRYYLPNLSEKNRDKH